MILTNSARRKSTKMKFHSGTEFCILHSTCSQIFNINNQLHQKTECKEQIENISCILGENLYKSTTYMTNAECAASPSPYARGASLRVGPISPGNYLRAAICFDLGTTRRRFVGEGFVSEEFLLPPNFFPSCSINPSQQKANLSPDPQGNSLPSCSTEQELDPE